MGTSTCHMVLGREPKIVEGMCGYVEDGILPGFFGFEAGQSCVGDHFAWFIENCVPASYEKEAKDRGISIHELLEEKASKLKPGQSGLLALDWNNGNRTVLVDARLTGLLIGQTLQTNRAEVYRALIEATAFGALTIHNRMKEYGVPIDRIICCGGIAEKNPLFMQIYADVLGRPMRLSASTQTCALGAAIMGAVAAGTAAGGYASVAQGQEAACAFQERVYRPDPAAAAVYQRLYALYLDLHDSFGRPRTTFDHAGVMKGLLEIRRQAEA